MSVFCPGPAPSVRGTDHAETLPPFANPVSVELTFVITCSACINKHRWGEVLTGAFAATVSAPPVEPWFPRVSSEELAMTGRGAASAASVLLLAARGHAAWTVGRQPHRSHHHSTRSATASRSVPRACSAWSLPPTAPRRPSLCTARRASSRASACAMEGAPSGSSTLLRRPGLLAAGSLSCGGRLPGV